MKRIEARGEGDEVWSVRIGGLVRLFRRGLEGGVTGFEPAEGGVLAFGLVALCDNRRDCAAGFAWLGHYVIFPSFQGKSASRGEELARSSRRC